MPSGYFEGLDIQAQNRYREKLLFRSQELPGPLNGGVVQFSFSSDSRNFSTITTADIFMYLVERVCFYTKEQFKSHKMGVAYNAIVSGKVRRLVSLKAGKRGEGIVVIAATVEASQTLMKAYNCGGLSRTTELLLVPIAHAWPSSENAALTSLLCSSV
ncbi:unnamed protein product [Ixodes hexagonus]